MNNIYTFNSEGEFRNEVEKEGYLYPGAQRVIEVGTTEDGEIGNKSLL